MKERMQYVSNLLFLTDLCTGTTFDTINFHNLLLLVPQQFTLKSTWWRVGNVLGQLLNVVMFYTQGNEWSPTLLGRIMIIGIALLILPLLLLICLQPVIETQERKTKNGEVKEEKEKEDDSNNSKTSCCTPPWIVFFSVLLRVTGKGMTLKFIPIFFVQVHNITPLTLTLLVLAGQIVSVFSPFACLVLARSIGRPQTMVLIRLIEPGALVVFGWWNNYYACCIVFVLFLGIPIGTRSIEKALLNDYTNKKSRARWNALEAVNRSTWSGSAVLGGWLSGMKHPDGWKLLFTSSAGTVSAALVVLSLLLVGGDMVVR